MSKENFDLKVMEVVNKIYSTESLKEERAVIDEFMDLMANELGVEHLVKSLRDYQSFNKTIRKSKSSISSSKAKKIVESKRKQKREESMSSFEKVLSTSSEEEQGALKFIKSFIEKTVCGEIMIFKNSEDNYNIDLFSENGRNVGAITFPDLNIALELDVEEIGEIQVQGFLEELNELKKKDEKLISSFFLCFT